jgi:hypothetical protein
MATTIPSTALVAVTPVFTNTERLALAGFLAGYSGLTRQAYELDLRQFASWCQQHQLQLFAARRAGHCRNARHAPQPARDPGPDLTGPAVANPASWSESIRGQLPELKSRIAVMVAGHPGLPGGGVYVLLGSVPDPAGGGL